MTVSRSDQDSGRDRRPILDRRDVELERLRRERNELLARERIARAEAETAQRRLSELASMSKRFAASMRGTSAERQRSRRRLAVQLAVGRVLADAGGLADTAPRFLEAFGEGLGWEAGVLWMVDREAGVLRRYAVWQTPEDGFEGEIRRETFPRGVGLPGRVWEKGEAVRAQGAIAFPVRDGGRLLGVAEFFGSAGAPRDEDLLRTATLVGQQIGQFIERRWAEEDRERLLVRERKARAGADAARERTADILESINDAFLALDRDGRFTYLNRKAEQLWGKPQEELLGRNVWEALPEAVDSEFYRGIEKAFREGAAVGFEAVSPVLGTWISARIYPTADGISAFFQDVTERKRAEQEREELKREAEVGRARLEAVLQQMPGGVFIADLSGEIILANEGAKRIYGKQIRSVEECGQHSRSYPGGEELPPKLYPLARAFEGEFVSGMEYFVLRADGTRGIVNANSAPVRDEKGRIVAAVNVFRDVTRHKKADKALKESEERLQLALDATQTGTFAWDPAADHTESDERTLAIFGLPPGTDITLAFALEQLLYREDRAAVSAAIETALDPAGDGRYDASFHIHPGGEERWVEQHGRMYFEGEGRQRRPVRMVGTIRDVTEKKRAEKERNLYLRREREAREAAEAAQERLAFSAGAADERRRISRELHDRVAHWIAVVHQSLELREALKTRDAARAEAKISQARELAKSALDSTRDLSMALRASEVEEGLGPALSKLLGTTVPPEVDYAVSVEGEESLVPAHVRDQLFLVLREAVRNAASHSGCRKISVELDIAPERVAGRVEDDGRGFDPERARRDGTSGLRSMEERAALVGGTFDLWSDTNGGTRAEVSVSLKEA